MTADRAERRPSPTPDADGSSSLAEPAANALDHVASGEILRRAQKMEALGSLVAGVAHELNNPLASIVAFSQLIRTDPHLPDGLRRQADLLVQEANRTREIVRNLLDFARVRPPERAPTELRPLIDSALRLQSSVLSANRLTVHVDVPDDLPVIAADRSQLQLVLINLTLNSAQAIRGLGRPGTIRIRARPDASGMASVVRIEIADDGPGVPAHIVDRLFMPFVTSKDPGAGTGLGLSVAFGIVESHGGTLRYEPNGAGGATFIIELPVEPGLTPETSRERPSPVARASEGPAPARRLRVLVLDDEESIRDFLGRVITRQGFEPILATSGTAALEIIRIDPPDVILCDQRMAGMSGTEFHAEVAQIAPQLGHRFALMSGDVSNPELRELARARGVHLLAKPFDIAAVGTTIAALLANEAKPTGG